MRHIENPLIPANQPYDPTKDLIENSAWGYYTRGEARCANGQRTLGLEDLEKAKQLNPNDGLIYWSIAIEHQTEDPAKAIYEFQQAAELFEKQGRQDMLSSALNSIQRLCANES